MNDFAKLPGVRVTSRVGSDVDLYLFEEEQHTGVVLKPQGRGFYYYVKPSHGHG